MEERETRLEANEIRAGVEAACVIIVCSEKVAFIIHNDGTKVTIIKRLVSPMTERCVMKGTGDRQGLQKWLTRTPVL